MQKTRAYYLNDSELMMIAHALESNAECLRREIKESGSKGNVFSIVSGMAQSMERLSVGLKDTLDRLQKADSEKATS